MDQGHGHESGGAITASELRLIHPLSTLAHSRGFRYGYVPLSSSRKERPRVSLPAHATSPADSAIGAISASAAPTRVGMKPARAKAWTETPPNLLAPATRPVARPRMPSG